MRAVFELREVVNRLTRLCLALPSPAGTSIPMRVTRPLCLLPPWTPAMFSFPSAIALLGR